MVVSFMALGFHAKFFRPTANRSRYRIQGKLTRHVLISALRKDRFFRCCWKPMFHVGGLLSSQIAKLCIAENEYATINL
jgi:hypothetical protein